MQRSALPASLLSVTACALSAPSPHHDPPPPQTAGQPEPLALDDQRKPLLQLHQCCVEERVVEEEGDGADCVVRWVGAWVGGGLMGGSTDKYAQASSAATKCGHGCVARGAGCRRWLSPARTCRCCRPCPLQAAWPQRLPASPLQARDACVHPGGSAAGDGAGGAAGGESHRGCLAARCGDLLSGSTHPSQPPLGVHRSSHGCSRCRPPFTDVCSPPIPVCPPPPPAVPRLRGARRRRRVRVLGRGAVQQLPGGAGGV